MMCSNSKQLNLPEFSTFPSLGSNPQYYSKCFQFYRDNTTEKEDLMQWIREDFESAVVEKLHLPSALTSTALKVLGIGSGNGEIEFEMLLRLCKKFPKIEITVVEPSEERIAEYKQRAKTRTEDVQGITWIWKQERIEDFIRNNLDSFNLITMIHVLYFVEVTQLKGHLSRVHQILTDDGLMVLVHDKAEPNQSIERGFFRFGTSTSRRPYTTENYIVDALDNLSIPRQLVHTFPTTLNITECFTNNPLSEEGCCLLDVLLFVDCVRYLKPEELQSTIDFFRRGSRRSGEKWFYNAPASAILVPKNSN